jgi:hypothetical protein
LIHPVSYKTTHSILSLVRQLGIKPSKQSIDQASIPCFETQLRPPPDGQIFIVADSCLSSLIGWCCFALGRLNLRRRCSWRARSSVAFLANMTNRTNDQTKAATALVNQRTTLNTLIAAMPVNVTAGSQSRSSLVKIFHASS